MVLIVWDRCEMGSMTVKYWGVDTRVLEVLDVSLLARVKSRFEIRREWKWGALFVLFWKRECLS